MDREKTKIKRDNFITVQGWMILDLNLKGNELLIYACIYGFTQTESQWFTGNRQYLADWTNSTKQGVQKCLNSLVAKGLIDKREKYENGVKFCEYRATEFTSQQSLPVNKVYHPSQQSLLGVGNKVYHPSQQSLPNNIKDIDNIKDSTNHSNIDCSELNKASEPTPEEPHAITITLNTHEEYPIYQTDIDEWKELYPAVDVMQELRKMKGWCNANPAKRKTKSGIRRFINSWLAREQDRGRSYKAPAEEQRGLSREEQEQEMIRRLNGM